MLHPKYRRVKPCISSVNVQCMERNIVEKDIAEGIKKEFDKRHGPTWHCVVGRQFGGCRNLKAVRCTGLEHVLVAQHKLHDSDILESINRLPLDLRPKDTRIAVTVSKSILLCEIISECDRAFSQNRAALCRLTRNA